MFFRIFILFDCKSGVVPFLLETVGSKDRELQEASAGCLQNIRKLALRAEELEFRGEH